MNDPLYNHTVFGPDKGKAGNIGKSDDELIHDLISIHNAENWLGGEGEDFAPNFFSSSIAPDVVSVATPASSSGSAGRASAVSSRSATPDTGAAPNPPVKQEVSAPAAEETSPEELESKQVLPSSSNDRPEKASDKQRDPVAEKPEEERAEKADNGTYLDTCFITCDANISSFRIKKFQPIARSIRKK